MRLSSLIKLKVINSSTIEREGKGGRWGGRGGAVSHPPLADDGAYSDAGTSDVTTWLTTSRLPHLAPRILEFSRAIKMAVVVERGRGSAVLLKN